MKIANHFKILALAVALIYGAAFLLMFHWGTSIPTLLFILYHFYKNAPELTKD